MGDSEIEGDSAGGGWIVESRIDRDDSIGYEVAEAVAVATDTAMEDLPPLYRSIDTDALNGLVAPRRDGSARSKVAVEFEYHGAVVTVDGETIEARIPGE